MAESIRFLVVIQTVSDDEGGPVPFGFRRSMAVRRAGHRRQRSPNGGFGGSGNGFRSRVGAFNPVSEF